VIVLLLLSCFLEINRQNDALVSDFAGIHEPIYRAYMLSGDPDALHKLLSGRFSGEALTREYIEHFLALQRLIEQKTTIEIAAVRYRSIEVISRRTGHARLAADWTVEGTITHRGHSHTRTNRYAAIYTVAETADGLRIVDTRLKNLERLSGRLSTGERGGLTPLQLLEGP
jgi:hypothetical protein